jgi:hypothetical protein
MRTDRLRDKTSLLCINFMNFDQKRVEMAYNLEHGVSEMYVGPS